MGQEEERVAMLRLIRSTRVGVHTFWMLVRLHGTAQSALEALPELARRGGAQKYKVCPLSTAEEEWEQTLRLGGRFLFANEEDYPSLLKHIPDRPPVLTMMGEPSLLPAFQKESVLAMVGARNASLNGRQFAALLAKELGERDFLVVSGLARGIDTRVHEGSLPTGTCAVVAGGIDVIYPPENTTLYASIKKQGILLTEMPLKTFPSAAFFPKRNRIIAGLSRGVVVVEAALRSGSLITAHCALEYGREVFAVPGSPFDPRCRGTNSLLKNGATLVERVEDILQNLYSPPLAKEAKAMPEGTPGALEPVSEKLVQEAREQILQLLSPSPTKLDLLIEALPHPLSAILTALVELEVSGRIGYTAWRHVYLTVDLPEERPFHEASSC
ncbi:MAG: DNA-processing protein DprA [Holosporales bacterium]|jgi:DNA processing protein|nr:DNA-processing protein DprA [Holosporales bacterium]